MLTRRRRRWYAILDIPKTLQGHFGKRRFTKTLQTDSLDVAKRRAPVLIAAWKAQIEQARGNVAHDDTAYWQAQFAAAGTEAERANIRHQITLASEVPPTVVHSADTEPVEIEERLAAAAAKEQRQYDLATGKVVRLADHIDGWLAEIDITPRNKVVATREINRFAEHHPEVDEINRKQVQAWANILALELAPATIRKRLSHLRSYWRYLVRHDLAPDVRPFDEIGLPRKKAAAREAFTVEEVRMLLDCSERALHDLIALSAHTGARIEELCSLRVKDVNAGSFVIRAAKSDAGIREVPIHRDIADLMERLKAQSQDGFIIPGLRTDRHGYRSNAMGQRFSQLKRNMGFPSELTFHSLRRFVSSSLEAAGVAELISARILGHKMSSMSYGVYSHSGATPLDEKRRALERAIRIL